MKIVNEKPPVWDAICAAFNIIPGEGVLFTYGDTIYNPSGIGPIPDHIIIHEEVHERQQTTEGMTPELWWGKFLRDPKFRVDQEIEAYAEQYAFICESVRDRNARHRALHQLASIMAGPLYNKAISYQQAMERIRNQANI